MLMPDHNGSQWVPVAKITDIPVRSTRVVVTETIRIALFRTSSEAIYALEDRCPHRNGPLSEGLVHGERVTCPLHQMVFELKTGEAVYPDEGCVTRFPVELRADDVWLDLAAGATKAGHHTAETAAGCTV